jgi:protein-disulfide isomerase
MAVAFVHREFRSTGGSAVIAGQLAARTRVSGWDNLVKTGTLIGDSSAAVKVVEFGDFECPFCRRADSVFRVVKHKFGADVALVYIEFPLGMHRFALPAARAAECAAGQGHFAPMHDLLFTKQDSLGLKSWQSYAQESGVPDTAAFAKCVSESTVPARVARGKILAIR